jgi:hypothetical protein
LGTHVAHALWVVADLTSAGNLAVTPRRDTHHVEVVGVNYWARLATSSHGIKEVVVVIVVVETVDGLWGWGSTSLAHGRTATHVQLLLSELDLTLPEHQFPLTDGETILRGSSILVRTDTRRTSGTALNHIIVQH